MEHTDIKQNQTERKKYFEHTAAMLCGVFLITVVGMHLYTNAKYEAYISISIDVLAEQEARLTATAHALARGSVSVPAEVLSDCPANERYRFDELLSSLATLDRAGLQELQLLFGGCAYYFASVQQVGVASLEREVAVYTDFLRMVRVFDSSYDTEFAALERWQQLVQVEQERSELHGQLVAIQADIVTRLLAFETINSASVQKLVSEGQEVRENINWLLQQSESLRVELLDTAS